MPGYDPVVRSRPPTSGQFSTRPSSPDYDYNDIDRDDDSDEGPGSSPPQVGHHPSPGHEEHAGDSMEGIQTANSSQTAVSGQRRMSRTSPSAEGSNGISGHANEVPQEYRAEVERIFFEFLTKTCSNRESLPLYLGINMQL